MSSKKGFGALGFIILFLLLIVMWIFLLAPLLSFAGTNAVASGATGMEAFFWNNLNLWVFFALFIVLIIYLRGGG